MTKTKAIRLVNELISKYGEDFVVAKYLDEPKRTQAWYEDKRLSDDECIYKQVTLKEILDGTSSPDWNPNDLREMIENLQKGRTAPETEWVYPPESVEALEKFKNENEELVKKKEEKAQQIFKEYMRLYGMKQ